MPRGLRTGCSKWREWTETTGWQVTPGKPRPTGGTHAGEEEGGRLGGYIGKASQPAVETVSSVSRPGESACGPRGRRKDALLGWRGTVGRRTAAAGKRWEETGGRGRCGVLAGPGGNVALWWDREERWERQGETWCAGVWLSSEWANRPTAHSKDYAAKATLYMGFTCIRTEWSRRDGILVVAFSGIVTAAAIGSPHPRAQLMTSLAIISDLNLCNQRGILSIEQTGIVSMMMRVVSLELDARYLQM